MSVKLGKNALVVGGTRGLGFSLVSALQSRGLTVYTSVRSSAEKDKTEYPKGVKVIHDVDLVKEGASADVLLKGLDSVKLDLVIYSAGVFKTDKLESLNWQDQLAMYTTCSIAPIFIASSLLKSDSFSANARFLLVTTEGGSIGLRTQEEGGGNYGHHGSKAASNMMGKLLSLDLGPKGVTVCNIHPGFMRTEMTKNIGYDKYWDDGGAVEPSVAADSMLDFAETMTMEKHNGGFWAPRGPKDIGEAERVMGKDLPTPLELPW